MLATGTRVRVSFDVVTQVLEAIDDAEEVDSSYTLR